MSNKKLEKKIEKLRKKYPYEPLRIDTVNNTVETEEQYRKRLKKRNEDLLLGIFIGIFIGLTLSVFYDIIQQFFNFSIIHKLVLLIVLFTPRSRKAIIDT